MGLHSSIAHIEKEVYKDSVMHKLDGRIKIIMALGMIIYAVTVPDIIPLLLLESYLLILLLLSRLSLLYILARILLILPFGGVIALFQPFIRSGVVLYSLPFGLVITYEGILFGLLLFFKLIVCVTAIILLSSTTPMQELVSSARRLGLPREFALLLGLMTRYLFVFYDAFQRIRVAQKTRCFSVRGKSYKWVLEQIGYTIGTLFIRAYEQGEKVYLSMLSRGYNPDSQMYVSEKRIGAQDVAVMTMTLLVIGCLASAKYWL